LGGEKEVALVPIGISGVENVECEKGQLAIRRASGRGFEGIVVTFANSAVHPIYNALPALGVLLVRGQ